MGWSIAKSLPATESSHSRPEAAIQRKPYWQECLRLALGSWIWGGPTHLDKRGSLCLDCAFLLSIWNFGPCSRDAYVTSL